MKKRIVCLVLAFVFMTSGCAIVPLECEHKYTSECDERCNICNAIRQDGPFDVHNMGKWKSNGDATCEADGTKYRSCVNCGKTEVAMDEGTATGHFFVDAVFNNDATHTTDGTETLKCMLCGKRGETRVAEGSAGHCPEGRVGHHDYYSGRCKECGWAPPVLKNTNVYVNESFEGFRLGRGFAESVKDPYARLRVEAWTKKEGVSFSVSRIYGREETNISALRVQRAAVAEEGNNDAIVDIRTNDGWADPIIPAYSTFEFDIMVGEGNEADIYLSGRKELETGWKYNIFLWYDAETRKLYVDKTAIADIDTGVWHSVSLSINDAERCYDVYVDGECVISRVTYLNSGYPAEEVLTELLRITANKGTGAVEFYLDNVVLYNGEYREN